MTTNQIHENDRVCLLTGAGGLLGSALCKAMVRRQNYWISGVIRNRHPEVDSQEIRFVNPLKDPVPSSEEPSTFVIRAHLEDENQVSRIVELTLSRFGRIDVLINNAVHYCVGSMVESRRLLEEASRHFEINTLIPLRLAVEVSRQFWNQRRAENIQFNRNVINVSSTAGLQVYEGNGQSIYGASKAALNSLTMHMASEFSKFGVRANAVAPNSFPSIVPTGRVVEEILRLDNGSVSGKVIRIDV